MKECPTAQNNTRALCYEMSKYQLMQTSSVKNMNCDSDVKIILNQYKQWSGNSHNVCVCEHLSEDGITVENLVGLTTADIQWAENHMPVTSGFPQCTKTEENFLKAIITVTKHRPVVMIQNYTQITMGIRFLAKNKIKMPHVHQNQIDGDQFPQPEGAGL